MTEVRLMTFKSAILARSVRISSCTPSVKKALSGSRLKFSNGSTATLFSGMVAAVVTFGAAKGGAGFVDLGAVWRARNQTTPPRSKRVISAKAMRNDFGLRVEMAGRTG